VAGEREDLLELAEEGAPQDWFSSFRDVFQGELFVDHLAPDNAGRFVYLERDAVVLKQFEAALVPGLLQTAEYIGAVCGLLFPEHTEQDLSRFVEFRLARQRKFFERADSPTLDIVLSEAVIMRRIGGPDIMRRQLEALIDQLTGELRAFDFRLTPLASNVRGSLGGPFIIMLFEDPREQDIVHLEGREGVNYLESNEAVARYEQLFRELKQASLSRHASIERLQAEVKKLS
jgi:hypothetical protein